MPCFRPPRLEPTCVGRIGDLPQFFDDDCLCSSDILGLAKRFILPFDRGGDDFAGVIGTSPEPKKGLILRRFVNMEEIFFPS